MTAIFEGLRDYINNKLGGPYDYNYGPARDYKSPYDYNNGPVFSQDYMGPNPSYSLGVVGGDYGDFQTKEDRDAWLRGEANNGRQEKQGFAPTEPGRV